MSEQHEWLRAGEKVAVIDSGSGRDRTVAAWLVKKRTATTVLLWRQAHGRDQELRVRLATLEKRQGGAWGSTSRVVPWDDSEAQRLRETQRRKSTARRVSEALRSLAGQSRPVTDEQWEDVAGEAVRLLEELLDQPGPAVSRQPKPPEVEVHVTPGAEKDAEEGCDGVVHLVCPHMDCRAVDRIAVVEDAGEVELGMAGGAFFDPESGSLGVDFATSDEYVETEWQDKHTCRACQRPVSMPGYEVSYDGADVPW